MTFFSTVLYHGESRIITLTVIDPDTGSYVDFSTGKWLASEIEWQVKSKLEAPDPPLISKSLAGGITMTPGAVAQQIKVFVLPADTPAIVPGGYMHDLVATFASGSRVYLIKPSGLTILGVVNQL